MVNTERRTARYTGIDAEKLRLKDAMNGVIPDKVPHFELVMPEKVIGKTTVANLQSGVINGYVGQVIYLVNEIRREMGCPDAKVIATGGMARLIAQKSGVIDHIDGLLTLKGLRLIYEKNQAKA